MSPGTRKRITRIKRLGCPQLVLALENGLLSPGGAEGLLHLSPAEQAAQVAGRQAQRERREHRARVAAQIIGNYLDNHQDHVDLAELRQLLQAHNGVAAC